MKKENIVPLFGILLLVAAFGIYAYGIMQAILISFGQRTNTALPEAFSTTISSIQGILLANFGMLLGISVAKPDSTLAKQMLFMNRNSAQGLEEEKPLDPSETIQLWGAGIYMASMVLCLIIWCIIDAYPAQEYKLAPFIGESAKMFLGVVLAYVTVAFGKKIANSNGSERPSGLKRDLNGLAANFHFEITVPENVRLTRINIDGVKIEGEELSDLADQAVNRILKGSKFVPLGLETIFFIIEAVGEPNREVSAVLKFLDRDVNLHPSKFMIRNNRRGLLALESVPLP